MRLIFFIFVSSLTSWSVCPGSYSLRRMETERERKIRIKGEREEIENSHDCRLECLPGILIIQRNKIWKPSTLQRANWYQVGEMWLEVCSQLHLRWAFSCSSPLKVSLCKLSSSLKVHMTFFSQRFSSSCSCKVVGYCSMKLNNNCNCTFFPEDLKYWRYSLNAFIQTCLWPLVHLSRASNNLKRANFSLWTFRGHVG